MRFASVLLLAIIIFGGCAANKRPLSNDSPAEPLIIRWQRLVDEEGQTCQRCGITENEVETAYQNLKESFAPLGIQVILVEIALDTETCAKDISQSNRIWIGERPLEEWLNAGVGQSLCGSCCGELGEEVECRTVEVDGKTYEAIPSKLIIKAGLLAASELLGGQTNEPCCPEGCSTEESTCTGCSDSDCPATKNE